MYVVLPTFTLIFPTLCEPTFMWSVHLYMILQTYKKCCLSLCGLTYLYVMLPTFMWYCTPLCNVARIKKVFTMNYSTQPYKGFANNQPHKVLTTIQPISQHPPSHINTQIYLYSCARTLAGGQGSAGCRWRPQRRWSGCWCQSAPGSCRCPAGPTWLWAARRTCASPGQTRSWCWSRQCPGCHPQLQHDQTATSIMIWAFTS